MRAAYKQYMAGEYKSSLSNYIAAAAESGSVEGQVNSAFMFEQGVCLGMNHLNCMKASVGMRRAAARQGNEEACLRVGDFCYDGRLREDIDPDNMFDGITDRGIDISVAPLPWIRYILYPEELFPKARKLAINGIRWLLSKVGTSSDNSMLQRLEEQGFCSKTSDGEIPSCAKPADTILKLEKNRRSTSKLQRTTIGKQLLIMVVAQDIIST